MQNLLNVVTKRMSRANLRGANLRGADLRGADLSEANLRGANLRGANLRWADLSRADLSEADLRGANLRGANLSEADLRGADLSRANLRGADLRWADLIGAKNTLLGGQRSDGYQFYLTNKDSGWRVIAGCRDMTISDYKNHVKTYNDKEKEFETLLLLDHLEARLNFYLDNEKE